MSRGFLTHICLGPQIFRKFLFPGVILPCPHWVKTLIGALQPKAIWAATWQNQQNEYAPSQDSDQPGRIESSLCPQWIAKDPRFLQADSEDSDQTRRMPRLIWVFAVRTVILLVLSCRGSYNNKAEGTVNIWAASWQSQQNGMNIQRRL